MDLSVVIVNYNVKYYLEQCLLSVEQASEGLEVEVWVVDNASTDGSMEYLMPRFPKVHFILNHENVGFSKANNKAISQSTGRYVLLLNPDTLITAHTLRDCIEHLDSTPDAGAVGVSMYGADGKFARESRRALPVPFTSFCKICGLTSLFPKSRLFGRYYMGFLDRNEKSPIEVISGAYNMLRRSALDKVGLLDEQFFMYGEDIDLSYRMTLGGWDNWYLPTPILHYKGESTQKDTVRYVNIFYEAMIIFMEKHFRRRYHHMTYLFRLGVYLRAGVSIIKRFFERMFSWVPKPKPRAKRLFFDGPEDHRLLLQQLCGTRGWTCTSELDNQTDYLVFDCLTDTYTTMLETLIDKHRNNKHLQIAILSPDQHVLILPYEVLV